MAISEDILLQVSDTFRNAQPHAFKVALEALQSACETESAQNFPKTRELFKNTLFKLPVSKQDPRTLLQYALETQKPTDPQIQCFYELITPPKDRHHRGLGTQIFNSEPDPLIVACANGNRAMVKLLLPCYIYQLSDKNAAQVLQTRIVKAITAAHEDVIVDILGVGVTKDDGMSASQLRALNQSREQSRELMAGKFLEILKSGIEKNALQQSLPASFAQMDKLPKTGTPTKSPRRLYLDNNNDDDEDCASPGTKVLATFSTTSFSTPISAQNDLAHIQHRRNALLAAIKSPLTCAGSNAATLNSAKILIDELRSNMSTGDSETDPLVLACTHKRDDILAVLLVYYRKNAEFWGEEKYPKIRHCIDKVLEISNHQKEESSPSMSRKI